MSVKQLTVNDRRLSPCHPPNFFRWGIKVSCGDRGRVIDISCILVSRRCLTCRAPSHSGITSRSNPRFAVVVQLASRKSGRGEVYELRRVAETFRREPCGLISPPERVGRRSEASTAWARSCANVRAASLEAMSVSSEILCPFGGRCTTAERQCAHVVAVPLTSNSPCTSTNVRKCPPPCPGLNSGSPLGRKKRAARQRIPIALEVGGGSGTDVSPCATFLGSTIS